MSYGSSQWQSWVKDEKESLAMIEKAYNAGINFFDTADGYSNGESERILGKAIQQFNMDRSRIVVATKVFFPVADQVSTNLLGGHDCSQNPVLVNRYGLSRKHIFDAVDASLERLQLDYIDLYQIHRLDPDTPMEEIMCALNDLVRMGKVRYIGASSMYAWQFQKMNNIAEKNGWARFVSMQNLYNLLYREEEREMMPYCADQGIAVIPWSPLARGLLTGKNRQSTRSSTDRAIKRFFEQATEANNDAIVDRVVQIAENKGLAPAHVALAWVLSKPFVTAPIVGISKESHLEDAIEALGVELSKEEIESLEALYMPRSVHSMN
ncbi:Aldo/keto reductase [Lichtheimia hyalospora FSU 10163]|nr:Aldo/keto reductase [Lichtheimia hyalospora FSU 10163]